MTAPSGVAPRDPGGNRGTSASPAPAAIPSYASSVDALLEALAQQRYIADRTLGTALYLALRLQKPLLVEGEPGCGKTEIGKVLALASGAELLRLQCYEGLEASSALYEWNYSKQLLAIRLHERETSSAALEAQIYSEPFLLRRPLLRSLDGSAGERPVLLIDEIDRADEEFEGLLLEVLSEFQVTIPELGTIRAQTIPVVVLTSNRTRELSDALKRRCLYTYIGYPDHDKELAILHRKLPELESRLAEEIVRFVQNLRAEPDLAKRPGVAETLDWAAALLALGERGVRRESVVETLGLLLKDARDLESYRGERLSDVLPKA